eukprot:g11954.t1
MSSSAYHHQYRSAPTHFLLASATAMVDAFFATFPAQLASGPRVQQRQQRHSRVATSLPTARGEHDDYPAAASEEDAGEDAGEELRDCVIVGAGVAGLSTAIDLERAGVDFVLLEAADRLGGRIFTHKESQSRYNREHEEGGDSSSSSSSSDSGDGIGRPLELGAQWLHGTEANPLFDFCIEEGLFDSQEGEAELALAKRAYNPGFQARRPDGTLVSRREFIRHSDAWSKAILEAEMLHEISLQAGYQGDGGREDEVGTFVHHRVREILRTGTGGDGQGDGPGAIDEGILGYLLRRQHVIEGCDDLNSVAISGYSMYEELGGGDVRVPGGFSRVVDALAGKISPDRARLNSPVTLVQWATEEGEGGGGGGSEKGAATSSTKTYRDDHPSHPCVVEYSTTRTGDQTGAGSGKEREKGKGEIRRVRCKRVVVTVSLGVLKDGKSLLFSPPLPPAKLSAIRRLGFGTTDKVFVRCTRERDSGGDRAGPDPSLHVGVLRPTGEPQQLQREQGRDTKIKDLPPPWIDDIFSFEAEGEYVYSWLIGTSAKAVETDARPAKVTHALLSLLRAATQDPSWQPSPEFVEPRSSGDDSASGRGMGQERRVLPPPLAPLPQARGTAARSPDALVRSDWNSNPLFRGSYSYIATGSSPADMEELARPLSVSASAPLTRAGGTGIAVDSPVAADEASQAGRYRGKHLETGRAGANPISCARVIFAGEAMHQQFFSTAHGGFETGRRAAREVLASCGFKMAVEAEAHSAQGD